MLAAGGSCPAGARPAMVVTLLVRCRRRTGIARALPQLTLGVVSERASTGRGARGWLRVSGSGLSSPLDPRFFVSAFSGRDSAFARPIGGSATAGALLRLRIHRWRASRGKDSSFAWNGPHQGRIVRHPNAKCTQDSSFTRARPNASAFTTGSRRQRRILRPTPAPTHSPRPQTSAAASRPVEALSKTIPSEGRGSAAARRDPLRQRTSEVRPPASAQRQAQTPAAAQRQGHHVTPSGCPTSRSRGR